MRLFQIGLAAILLTTGLMAKAQSNSPAAQIAAIGGPAITPAGSVTSALVSRAGNGGGLTLTAVPEDFSKLRIEPGFLLDAEVFDEPDMSGALRVGTDGTIVMPLAGAVHVAGDTMAQAEHQMEDKLISAEILKKPQVTLNVLQYAPTMVTVLGEVNTPGRLQMLVPHSLLDVLSFAGGETSLAGDKIELRHEHNGKTVVTTYRYGRDSNGDSIGDVMVHDGDTVIVPRAGIVYVLGDVYRPGGYLMQEDGKLDVAQALALAMGTQLSAKTKDMEVIRRRSDGSYVMLKVNYQKMVRGKTTPLILHAQDVVYVPVNKGKAVFTSTTGILGAAATASIYTVR